MILFLLIIILIISMVSIFYLIAFRRQIDYICRQLAFLEREDSNLKITSIGPGKEISRLINSINCVLEKYRKDSYEVRTHAANICGRSDKGIHLCFQTCGNPKLR